LILALSAIAFASACDLDVPPDAPFREPLPAGLARVELLVEIHPGTDSDWARAVANALTDRGLQGLVLVPWAPDPTLVSLASELSSAGHEIGITLGPEEVPDDHPAALLSEARRLRASARRLGRATGERPRTVLTRLPHRTTEAVLGLAGFRVVLQVDGPTTAEPRHAVAFAGQTVDGIVIPPGPYHGDCGSHPVVGPFTPASADRATIALRSASAAPGVAIVRVGLDGSRGVPEDASVLGRWLDEVVLPAGLRARTAIELRGVALDDPASNAQASPLAAGRLVAIADVTRAAESLRGLRTLPRRLAGDLTPTEAFLAFALLLAGDIEGDVVRLGALAGPRMSAHTALTGPIEVPRAEVATTAAALLASLPENVPSAVPVGGHLLTAAELLVLFASAVRGDLEPTTAPIAVPEPNEDGLGWGVATIP
jgi:hypothetical protein